MINNQKLDLSKFIKWSNSSEEDFLNNFVSTILNNFVSEENNYTVNGTIGKPVDNYPQIQQSTLTRKINALDYGIVTQLGSEEQLLTFEDIINKLKILGVNLETLINELTETAFNFAPPINVDKFANFKNYYWVKDEVDFNDMLSWNQDLTPEYYVIQRTENIAQWNDWQKTNKWYHKNDVLFTSGVYDISACIQAEMPIIEYKKDLELNNRFDAGTPVAPSLISSENNLNQFKTTANQVPLFNLYKNDGTHANVVSPIFHYTESLNADFNTTIGKRLSLDVNGDYEFSVSAYDSNSRQLNFKIDGALANIWKKTNVSKTARFVKEDVNGDIIDYPGNYDENRTDGAWLTPERLSQNLKRQHVSKLTPRDLIPHFLSISEEQTTDPFDYSLGGKLQDFSSNMPLLISVLNQTGISPISVLQFAENQYQSALSSAETFVITEFSRLAAKTKLQGIIDTSAEGSIVSAVLSAFENSRQIDKNIQSVFADTTAGVKYWPITLPMMGVIRGVEPSAEYFDYELGIDAILHHDGHISPLALKDTNINLLITNTVCERSDGTTTPGHVTFEAPPKPYAGQLWFNSSTEELKIFNVQFDTEDAPLTPANGDYWFKRSDVTLSHYVDGAWVLKTQQDINNRWQILNFEEIRNNLILAIERKLFDNIPPLFKDFLALDVKQIADNSKYASFELARFSQKYNYDTFAPDFDQTNAFTWNYFNANIDGISPKARWHDVYKEYFSVMSNSFDIIPTCRPNLEPWKLLGLEKKSDLYTYDGISKPFLEHFAKDSSDTNRNLWKSLMWDHIKEQRPGLKLCVYTADHPSLSDTLLPPFVSAQATIQQRENALLVSDELPQGINSPYTFGQNGPIESVWKKSIEYHYGLAISAFKLKPLVFLDKTWGMTYSLVGNNFLRVDRNIGLSLSHRNFLLHGEKLHVISRLDNSLLSSMVTINGLSPGEVITAEVGVIDDIQYFQIFDRARNALNVSNGPTTRKFFFLNEEVDIVDMSNITVKINSQGHTFENGESIRIENANGQLIISHFPALKKIYHGLGQLYTNSIRYSFSSNNFPRLINQFRKWDIKLCHKFNCTVVPESLNVNINNLNVVSDFYRSKLIKNEKTQVKRISALRVQLVDMGPLVDSNGNLTRIRNSDGILIPAGNADTWVFRIEGYDTRYPLLSYYEADTGGTFYSFKALNGRSTGIEWKKYSNSSSKITNTLPLIITGLQNLVNVIFGYVSLLEDDGWISGIKGNSVIDSETGLSLSWQLEVEKFIDTVYSGISAGSGFIMNPFMSEIAIKTPIGILSTFENETVLDTSLSQVVRDVVGDQIEIDNLLISRSDAKAVIKSKTPIYSAQVFLDEYENCLIFNDFFEYSGKSIYLFNQLTGETVESVFLKFNKQDASNKKPTLGGYILFQDTFIKNIMTDVDKISNFYDSTLSFNDDLASKHSLALLGFNKKDYFNNLSLDEKTQFNFWRGMIQAKGTNTSLDAFLNHKDSINSQVDELWAYKVAEFGDSREKSYPEIKISAFDCAQLFTRLQFFNQSDPDYTLIPLYTHVAADDYSRWFSLDDLGTHLKFDIQPIEETFTVSKTEVFPLYVRLSNIYLNEDGAGAVISGPGNPRIVNSRIARVDQPGEFAVKGFTWLTPSKISPIKLFDYTENTLIEEIGLWHPAIAIHAYRPLEIVDISSSENPAFYSNSLTVTINPNLKKLKPWGKNEVGKIWWNTSNLDYVPYYDSKIFSNRQVRETIWGALANWSDIELYEWIESDVHPSEYDKLSSEQEGNLEIAVEKRAAGKVAIKKLYERSRIVKIRPIAWSTMGNAIGDGHPAFGSSIFSKMYILGNAIVADRNSMAANNISPGMHFGGWKDDKPVGEVEIQNSIFHVIGSRLSINEPVLNVAGHFTADISLIQDGVFAPKLGQIRIDRTIDRTVDTILGAEGNVENVTLEKHFLKVTDDTGLFESVEITDWYSFNNQVDNSKTILFEKFAIQMTLKRKDSAPQKLTASDITNSISSAVQDLYVRQGIVFSEVLPLPSDTFVNDPTDPEYFNSDYEWRCWLLPAQKDLDADLQYEPRKWKTYAGDFIIVQPNPSILELIKNDVPLVLRDSTIISKFNTSWTDWVELTDVSSSVISDGKNIVSFDLPGNATAQNISVYENGQKISRGYSVSSTKVEMSSLYKEGTEIRLIIHKYQPTENELSFDPDTIDDVMILKHFKLDYEYSTEILRDENGNSIGNKFYFWVKDKSISSNNKKITLLQAKELLKNGDSQYAILTHISTDTNGKYFDACSIKGLNYIVTKDNSYKLRFIRDFTLRDDPEELALKNTHTQWELFSRNQNRKILKRLWDILTDSVCGQDIGGNMLPYQIRKDYDERNQTKTQFGFKQGQVLAPSHILRKSVSNTIINTQLTIKVGDNRYVPYYLSNLDFSKRDDWFSTPEKCRETMDLIWRTASVLQINDIFFNALDDAHTFNYEFENILKTSLIKIIIQKEI